VSGPVSVGRIVHYRMALYDVENYVVTPHGSVGNRPNQGDAYPAVVVRLNHAESGSVNLQVFLDGSDSYWATSRTEGDEPGHWFWPPRT
jgi:hypothetical protein